VYGVESVEATEQASPRGFILSRVVSVKFVSAWLPAEEEQGDAYAEPHAMICKHCRACPASRTRRSP